MKFTCTVIIDLSIEKVIELFDNIENLKEWQDGFVSFENISGTQGKPGAKSKIIYRSGKHVIELVETITVKNLPHEISGIYENEHMVNTMRNLFTSLGATQTKYEAELEYTAFNGFVPKMMALFTPGLFKKQTQKWLDQFKAFAEKERINRFSHLQT
jgi:hypothetical protein